MRAPSEAELLSMWERGVHRHPIDRALLLGAWARPDLPPDSLAEQPLGTIATALLRLRALSFGSRIQATAACRHCGERLEVELDAAQLLAGAASAAGPAEFEVSGVRFRLPCSLDLAAIAAEPDVHRAATALVRRCCLAAPAADCDWDALRGAVEAAMEERDPAADIALELRCDLCGSESVVSLDVGALLWAEFDARARAVLGEVHALARAYGWSEPEILALSPQRRATYLQMVDA